MLLGLLAWVWATDRPSPAYPDGQFGPLLLEAGVAIAVVSALVGCWRGLRSVR